MGKKTKKVKKGRGGVKKACILVLLMVGILFPISAFAQDIGWSKEYGMTDCVIVGEDINSANACFGTLGEVRLENGLKPLGLGGFAIGGNAGGGVTISIIPFTFFNDILWTGVTIDTSDFSFSDWREDVVPGIGISLTESFKKMWSK